MYVVGCKYSGKNKKHIPEEVICYLMISHRRACALYNDNIYTIYQYIKFDSYKVSSTIQPHNKHIIEKTKWADSVKNGKFQTRIKENIRLLGTIWIGYVARGE